MNAEIRAVGTVTFTEHVLMLLLCSTFGCRIMDIYLSIRAEELI